MNEYIYYYLRSVASGIDAQAKGTTFKEVSGKDVALIPFALPPLTEQQRIVAKVDELLQLCDELETRQLGRDELTRHLRASALYALFIAASGKDIRAAWSRIHDNWDSLTDHADSYDEIRNTILELAVRGMLAAQDPSEPPADELRALRHDLSNDSAPSSSKVVDD